MRHKKRIKTLGRVSSQRAALMKSLLHALIMNGHITTTITKAKVVKPQVEKLITTAKSDTLSAKKKLYHSLPHASAKKIVSLGKQYIDRKGGYTRITKLGRRVGDNAEKAKIEFV